MSHSNTKYVTPPPMTPSHNQLWPVFYFLCLANHRLSILKKAWASLLQNPSVGAGALPSISEPTSPHCPPPVRSQCQVDVQVLTFLNKKVLVIFWRWFTLTSWCQNLADIYSFSYMYDTYRHHLIKAGESYDWIPKNPDFDRNFERKKSGKLLFKAKFLSNYRR